MSLTLHRGTNVSHWLSQSRRRGDERRAYFTRVDVQRIADWGFDHIRLPIDEEQMFGVDGSPDSEAFDLLDQALDWCEAAGLNTVVDLHILRSHYFNDANVPALYTDPAQVQRFAELWATISGRIGSRSTQRVGYELLNEPVAPRDETWNQVYRVVYDRVRSLEPGRTIVLGSNHFQTPSRFEALEIPEDEHLILSFHFYYPMMVTHYKARWTLNGAYEGPIQYPGQPVPDDAVAAMDSALRDKLDAWTHWNAPCDAAAMLAQIQPPLRRSQQTGRPLYCGEFGCLDTAPLGIRQAWYRDLLGVFEGQGIAWANWDYRGHFGLIDNESQDTGLLPAIRQAASSPTP